MKQGTQLDILVEAMGRVNFDRAIHDRKGITERVELLTDDQHQTLKNWQVYSFPNDADFAAQKNFHKGDKLDGPTYYRATPPTTAPLSTWRKRETSSWTCRPGAKAWYGSMAKP